MVTVNVLKLKSSHAQKRGGSGVIAIQTSERNGAAIGAVQVIDEDEIMLITNGGILVRTKVQDVSVVGRNTQGVRLIKLGEGENSNPTCSCCKHGAGEMKCLMKTVIHHCVLLTIVKKSSHCLESLELLFD